MVILFFFLFAFDSTLTVALYWLENIIYFSCHWSPNQDIDFEKDMEKNQGIDIC